jgi:glycosyltransferase involved in cell wall biosynthesis
LKNKRPDDDGRIVCLSNVFEEEYASIRGEAIALPLSIEKRRDLFRCIEDAIGRRVMILSSPPKAKERRHPRWLPALETRFASHLQLVCSNLDAPKIRIPTSWALYAAHVMRHTRSGDVVLLDNYEWLYILAAYAAKQGRRLIFVLDYEDGKHAIDHGWQRLLSGWAEGLGRRLLRGALVAHPALASRLSPALPQELVPGFLHRASAPRAERSRSVKFLYSGTLDAPRGLDLILNAVAFLPTEGWELHITGSGALEEHVLAAANDARWKSKLHFHGVLPEVDYRNLMARCHIALNCQMSTNPVSAVTFPSKTFTYLSAGLGLISSTASCVPEVLGDACWYYRQETPEALARVMTERLESGITSPDADALHQLEARYSLAGTAKRLRAFFKQVSCPREALL